MNNTTNFLSNRKFKKIEGMSWRARKKALGGLKFDEGGYPRLKAVVKTVRPDGSPKFGYISFWRSEGAKIYTSGFWH